jgi:predicted dehydrogenase
LIDRVLIVGFGSIGKRHVRLARKLMPNVQIAVLRHKNCQELQGSDIDFCYTNLNDALQFQPQAAVIANPATHHLEVALSLAQAGVHLLIEKPISINSDGVETLLKTCRSLGTTLMVGYNLRFLPSLQKFRELLEERCVGQVLSVRAEIGKYLPSWRPGSDYRQTVSAKADLGGGVLLELSHEIDYLRWLFGEVEWVKAVQCKQSKLEIDVEDTAHLVMSLTQTDEATSTVVALNMDFIRHDTTRICTVIGERGTLRWNAVAGTVELFEQGNSEWQTLLTDLPQRDDSYLAEWRHFLECIEEKASPLISGEDGLAVLRIIEASRQSSNTGCTVSIKYEDPGTTNPEQY